MTLTQEMSRIRRAFPLLRRSEPTAIIHSGERRTIYGCVCGAQHSTSTEWHGRDAKHVRIWRAKHAACAVRLAASIEALGGAVHVCDSNGKVWVACAAPHEEIVAALLTVRARAEAQRDDATVAALNAKPAPPMSPAVAERIAANMAADLLADAPPTHP